MIINANALHIPLKDATVQCCVTSPPYYGLRDYGTAKWEGGDPECDHRQYLGGHNPDVSPKQLSSQGTQKYNYRNICGKCGAIRIDDQIGLEPTPDEYVAKLVSVFREVKRVLKDDGVLWLNLGDSYIGGKGKSGAIGADLQEIRHAKGASLNRGHQCLGEHGITKVTDDRKMLKQFGIKPKDLIGIPWMVAFALRQPYENVLIQDKVWRAWLAGIIDGEGCITSNEVTTSIDNGRAINPSYPIILQVRMSDRQALERIVEVTGISKVQDEHLSPSQIGKLQRPPSAWKTAGDNAMRLLAECYPYLTVKRDQALIAWNLQKLKVGIETKRGVPIPAENVEKRKLLYSIIRDLNQRREVDIPSWCEEPEIDIEPGWYLRSDCIWSKPNPMPESVKDRPTKAHEYLFLLAKSQKYYYDAEAIFEPASAVSVNRIKYGWDCDRVNIGTGGNGSVHTDRMGDRWVSKTRGFKTKDQLSDNQHHGKDIESYGLNGAGFKGHSGNYDADGNLLTHDIDGVPARNKRTVWTITTQPFKGAHFAVMPEKLVEPCILAGSRPGDVILDPFAGSGTVGVVAQKLGRGFVGIELNPEYVKLAETRMMDTPVSLFNQSILEEL